MDVEDLALSPGELAQEQQRREMTAAHVRWANSDQAKQMLMPYRHGKMAALQPGFEFKPGFIYTQVRAISARINQNYDGWPSSELKKSYRTFIGKPVFVNHQNFDYKKARGKVVAARYVEAGDDKYIETVMEIDAHRFPKLAHEIKTGGMDSVSMGVEAGFTICSYCGNRAVDVPEFCSHVKYHKGRVLPRINVKTGKHEDVLVYEKCYKLGFFELSYVFDPADETAVVSRVIAAAAAPAPPMDMPVAEMPYAEELPIAQMEASIQRLAETYSGEGDVEKKSGPFAGDDGSFPVGTQKDKNDAKAVCNFPSVKNKNPGTCSDIDKMSAQIYRLAYGEIEAPEDVDTLRDDEGDTHDDDFKHYVDSPAELRGPNLDQTKLRDQQQEDEGLDQGRRAEDVEDVAGTAMPINARRNPRYKGARAMRKSSASVLVDPRTGRRYYAADDDNGDEGAPPPPPPGGDDDSGPPPPDGGADPGASDADLIAEAEEDLEHAEDESQGDYSDDPGSDAGGTDDDYSDQDSGDDGDSDDDDGGDTHVHVHFHDHDGDDDSDDDSDSGDLPPWLAGGDDDLPPPPPHEARRRRGNSRSSTQKKRRKGAPMGLQSRGRVATADRRRHYAGDDGTTDGGPYHRDDNDQGEQEEVFISDTPPAQSFDPPVPGDSPISNTESNLVEGRLRKRILQRNAELKRDMIAYEQITGQRIGSRRRYAEDGYPPANSSQGAPGETPDEVNPTVDDPDGEDLTGDHFTSLQLPGGSGAETQPKDASVRFFRAFDQWLQRTTGRTAAQHGNPNFIRRSAARYCQASGVRVESLFPALGSVLREARRNEGRKAMRRQADDDLQFAAPQDRTDVEAPVSDIVSERGESSQYPTSEFGDNAGDNLADPDLDTDSQIWPPGEGDGTDFGTRKDSTRKADGITAVRYAEAFIAAGLAPNTPEEKWKIAGLAQTMRHGTIVDRISLLDAVNTTRRAAARRTAGANRGAARGLPPGLGQRQLTGGSQRMAANDIATDQAMFFK